MLAFDVSSSMTATDLTPTRMDVAKAAARAVVERQPPTVRVGVVARVRSCSPATVWRHSKAGILPEPEKLSPGITGWNVGKLRRNRAA